jgi:hypothetical protein
MSAKWPAMTMPDGALIDNDSSHGFKDPNGGGGPASPVVRNSKKIPDAQRGGSFQSGNKSYARTNIHGGRSGSGNPAGRGGMPSEGRQSFPSETRNPNGGGGVQVRNNFPPVSGRGGFGNGGQSGLPSSASSTRPGTGNTGGKMAKRITGHFNNKSKGPNASGNVGSYGDRAPITSNT